MTQARTVLELVGFHPRMLLIVHGISVFGYGWSVNETDMFTNSTIVAFILMVNGLAAIAWAAHPPLGRWWGAGVLGWSLLAFAARTTVLVAFTTPPFFRGVWALIGWSAALLYLWPTLAVGMELEATTRKR